MVRLITCMALKRKAQDLPELEPRTYQVQRILGQGSFGTVYQVSVTETNEVCAIKSCKPVGKKENGQPTYTIGGPDREVQILKELSGHPNIVLLKGAFASGTSDAPRLNLVFEFLSDTLHRVIKHYNQLNKGMDPHYMRLYFYHLMRGVAFMHGKGIAHCDLKPQNLLLDGRTHGLRICDFGTAKRFVHNQKRASYVCSRYFRAPEIILGSTSYTTSIDLWSAGCIFAEMIIRQPLFTGRDGVDQLVEMIKVIGTPTAEELKAMNPDYPVYDFSPKISPLPWKKILRESWASDLATDIISKLVVYDPTARLTPLNCLLHEYFDELRKQEKPQYQTLFNFREDELMWCTRSERDKLIPAYWRPKAEH